MNDVLESVFSLRSWCEVMPLMGLGTLLILTLVLDKGEICAGQRGRLHKVLPVVAITWLVGGLSTLFWLPAAGALAYYYTQLRKGKARESGSLRFLSAINGYACLVVVGTLVSRYSVTSSVTLLLVLVLLGAALAHLLLVVSRSRLDAFHRLLPVIGVVATILLSLSILPYAYSLNDDQLAQAWVPTIISFLLLILACAVWVWPVIRTRKPLKTELGIVLVVVWSAGVMLHSLVS